MFLKESVSWRIIKHIIYPCEILEIVQAAGFKSTLRDIFIWIIILGIGILVVRKYGDFFQKSPNFVPQIKLSCFHAKLFQRNQNQFLMEFLKIVKN